PGGWHGPWPRPPWPPGPCGPWRRKGTGAGGFGGRSLKRIVWWSGATGTRPYAVLQRTPEPSSNPLPLPRELGRAMTRVSARRGFTSTSSGAPTLDTSPCGTWTLTASPSGGLTATPPAVTVTESAAAEGLSVART